MIVKLISLKKYLIWWLIIDLVKNIYKKYHTIIKIIIHLHVKIPASYFTIDNTNKRSYDNWLNFF